MKKSIIITIIIAVVILGLFIGMAVLGRGVTNKSLSKASNVARNASIRSTTSMIIPYIEIWGSENKNSFSGFIENPSNFAKIKPFIDDLENRLNVKMRYSILSTDINYAVRLGVEGENLFYCIDSTGVGSSEHTESETDQFTSKTNCAGQSL